MSRRSGSACFCRALDHYKSHRPFMYICQSCSIALWEAYSMSTKRCSWPSLNRAPTDFWSLSLWAGFFFVVGGYWAEVHLHWPSLCHWMRLGAFQGVSLPATQSSANYLLLAVTYASFILFKKRPIRGATWAYAALALIDVQANMLIVAAFRWIFSRFLWSIQCLWNIDREKSEDEKRWFALYDRQMPNVLEAYRGRHSIQ